MSFEPGTFEEVRARAAGRLLVVDFGADWCAPCRRMEKTVWPDARVEAWLAAHALACKVDVEVEKDVAERFRVRSLPTMMVLRGDEELDRRTGMTSAADLVAWLEGVVAGRKWIDALREAARGDDVRAHHDLARVLRERGELDEALDELLWVWTHALRHAPEYVGVKHSYLVEELRAIAEHHAPARARLSTLRDDAGRAFATMPTRENVRDWTSLARASGDASAVLAWLDGLDAAPAGIEIDHLEHCLGDALLDDRRRAAIGRMYPSADATLATARSLRDRIAAQPVPEGVDFDMRKFADEQYALHLDRARRAYLAAGRDVEVAAIDAARTD